MYTKYKLRFFKSFPSRERKNGGSHSPVEPACPLGNCVQKAMLGSWVPKLVIYSMLIVYIKKVIQLINAAEEKKLQYLL